jgi:uncharacterized membrane protein SirB2
MTPEQFQKVIWPLIRDVLLFFTGLVLMINEALRMGVERPFLLAAYLVMMSLPIPFRAESPFRANGNGRDNGDDSGDSK